MSLRSGNPNVRVWNRKDRQSNKNSLKQRYFCDGCEKKNVLTKSFSQSFQGLSVISNFFAPSPEHTYDGEKFSVGRAILFGRTIFNRTPWLPIVQNDVRMTEIDDQNGSKIIFFGAKTFVLYKNVIDSVE
jgi:hypothetical protein